jgi:hypothetical protein
MFRFFANLPVQSFHFLSGAIAREVDGNRRDDFAYQSSFRLGRGA